MYTETPAEEQHLFEDENFIHYDTASKGQRFLNFIIDNLFIRFALSYIVGWAIGYLLVLMDIRPTFTSVTDFSFLAFSYLVGSIMYLLYYTISEKAFNGRTLGKLITGTKAIRLDGEEITFKDALLRSLSRIVPFEVFSGLGFEPWHDSWTRTTVIKTR